MGRCGAFLWARYSKDGEARLLESRRTSPDSAAVRRPPAWSTGVC